MDLVKTLLVYMMVLVGSATEASPAVTPIPADAVITPTPYVTSTPYVSPSPTASPTPNTSYVTMYVGDKGSNVRRLQSRLKELGYLSDKVDGAYGQNTKKAVEAFQKNNGLNADGIAGKATQTLLFESTAVVPAGTAATPSPTPTATPAIALSVPVYYVDNATGALLTRTSVLCYSRTTVYADVSYVPDGYTLSGSASVVVTVSGGRASPSSVTFRYDAPSPSAPTKYAAVPVYLKDTSGTLLASYTVSCAYNAATTVYADASRYPSGYVLSSGDRTTVTVSAGGAASPSAVTFYLKKSVTPTPDVSYVSVPVYYCTTSGVQLTVTSVSIQKGKTQTVYFDDSLIPYGYTLSSAESVKVKVSAAGKASPASVTFYARKTATPTPTPTATPVSAVTVNVYYLNEANEMLYQTTARCQALTDTYVYADLSRVSGYDLVGDDNMPVYVNERGEATPNMVTFYFRPKTQETETPAPGETETPGPGETETPGPGETETPAPGETDPAQVAPVHIYVYYRNAKNEDIALRQRVLCQPGTTTIQAQPEGLGQGYVLDDDEFKDVVVDENGATPDELIFIYRLDNTDAPQETETPAPGALTAQGLSSVNGKEVGAWYRDAAGNALVCLEDVLNAASIEMTKTEDGFTAQVNGCLISVSYTETEALAANADGRDCDSAYVLDGKLYVSLDLLGFAGGTYDLVGDSLSLTL